MEPLPIFYIISFICLLIKFQQRENNNIVYNLVQGCKQTKGFSAQAYRGTLRTENPFFALYCWTFDVKPVGG